MEKGRNTVNGGKRYNHAGDFAFLYKDKGELIQARLTAKGYQEVSRTRLLDPSPGRKAWPPPAYAKEHLCVSLAAKPD